MMVEGGEPKLVDFGLAVLDSPAAAHLDSREPQQRAIVGTLAYMAPEALQGRMDARSDQFSFAAALWEALCGEFPYPIESIEPRDRATLRPPRLDTGLPAALFECLRRALQPEPYRRFPTMSELVSRLRQLQGELHRTTPIISVAAVPADLNIPSDTNPAAATATTTRVPGRSWGWLAFPAVGAAAVAAVLAQAGFWDSEAPVAAEETEATDEVVPPEAADAAPAELPPAPPVSAPTTPVVQVPPCAHVAPFAGKWHFDTTLQTAKPPMPGVLTGYYEIMLTLDNSDCSFTAELKKTGNDDLPPYKPPHRATLKKARIDPAEGRLAGQFVLKKYTYNFSLLFTGDKIGGGFNGTYWTGTDKGTFSGRVDGKRGAPEPKKRLTP